MLAKDVMTTNLATVRPDTALSEAIATMLDRHISGLPVVDGEGRLVGVLTEGDLLRRSELGTEPTRARWIDFLMGPGALAADYVRTHGRRVENLMTRDVVTVEPEAPLTDVVQLMERRHVKRVPVVRGDIIVGVISRADLLRALAAALRQAEQPKVLTDGEIREAILAEFHRNRWAPDEAVDVRVDEGVVILEGTIFDNRDRAAMMVAARNVPGVQSVQDNLTWIEPVSGTSIGPTV